MADHRAGTREEWLAARAELLAREKELTRMSDELARQRQELPWVPVKKEYTFQTADGPKTLAELFEGRSQLAVYHFSSARATRLPARAARRSRTQWDWQPTKRRRDSGRSNIALDVLSSVNSIDEVERPPSFDLSNADNAFEPGSV